MRRDLVGHFAERIDHVARSFTRFFDARDALQAYGTARIVSIDEREVVLRDRDRQAFALGATRALELCRRQIERGGERVGGSNGIAHFGLPVVQYGE